MLTLILLVAAFICACLAAIKASHPRIDFGWLAIALWMLTLLLGRGGV